MVDNQNRSVVKTGIQINELVVLLCIVAIWLAFNLLTASSSPIIETDEVLYTDPSANLYFGNGFTSTGWYAQSGDQFWAGNVPLHQIFLYYWIRIFGFNPTSVRSINYIYMAAVVIFIWLTTIRLDLIKKQISRLALVFLILTDYGITYSYRSGRTDVICILLCSLVFLSYSIRNKSLRYISISILSILFPFAGLQLIVYSFVLGSVLICFLKRALLKEFLIVQFSSLFGLFMLILVYIDRGVLKYFFLSIAPHSKLINNLVDNSNFVYDLVGDPSIQDRFSIIGLLIKPIIFLLRDYSTVCVLICLLIIIGYQISQKQFRFKSSAFFGVVQIVVISLALSIVGKIPAYYSWMIFIPTTISLLMTLDKFPYEHYNYRNILTIKITKIIIISNLILLIFASSGMFTRIFFKWERGDYSKVEKFVVENISKDDVVFCDEQAYYPAKTHAKKVFLPPYLRVISSAEKKSISVLIISPNSLIPFDKISKLIGGQWELKNSINEFSSNSFNIAKVKGYNLQVFSRLKKQEY